jgi:hypothetical protein
MEKKERNHKLPGQIATVVATVCGAILTAGVVTSPLGVVLLSVGATGFGLKAGYHASKIVTRKKENENNA